LEKQTKALPCDECERIGRLAANLFRWDWYTPCFKTLHLSLLQLCAFKAVMSAEDSEVLILIRQKKHCIKGN